jgi:ABC-type transport system involved in multi-copper enzyme maturation permease subunit
MIRSEKELPSQITQVGEICKHELRKLLRSKRAIGVIVLAVLGSVAVATFVTAFFSPRESPMILSFSLIFTPVMLIITAALVGSDALLVEFHEKTGFSLFPNPVSRVAIWTGKFLAAEIVMILVAGTYFGIIIAAAALQFQDTSATFLVAPAFFSLVLGTMLMSIAFLYSSVFRGPLGATIAVLFSLAVLPVADMVLASNGISPWFMPYSAANNVYTSLAALGGDLIIGDEFDRAIPVAMSVAVVVGYIAAFSAASIYFFSRRDM